MAQRDSGVKSGSGGDNCGFVEFPRGTPCPICTKLRRCKWKPADDVPGGLIVMCFRPGTGWFKECTPSGPWLYAIGFDLDERGKGQGHRKGTSRKPVKPTTVSGGIAVASSPAQSTPPDWVAVLHELAKTAPPNWRASLSRLWGLPQWSFDNFPMLTGGPCKDDQGSKDTKKANWQKFFAVPEVDGTGAVCGVMRIFPKDVAKVLRGDPDENKMLMGHGTRGLYVPHKWDRGDAALYLVEGASDTVALSAIGVAVLGRPNNGSGVKILAQFLKLHGWAANGKNAHRDIIVMAENDKKADGSHPGKEGAESTSRELAKLLGRATSISYPPGEFKDVRAWVIAHRSPEDPEFLWSMTGCDFEEKVLETAENVEPAKEGEQGGADQDEADTRQPDDTAVAKPTGSPPSSGTEVVAYAEAHAEGLAGGPSGKIALLESSYIESNFSAGDDKQQPKNDNRSGRPLVLSDLLFFRSGRCSRAYLLLLANKAVEKVRKAGLAVCKSWRCAACHGWRLSAYAYHFIECIEKSTDLHAAHVPKADWKPIGLRMSKAGVSYARISIVGGGYDVVADGEFRGSVPVAREEADRRLAAALCNLGEQTPRVVCGGKWTNGLAKSKKEWRCLGMSRSRTLKEARKTIESHGITPLKVEADPKSQSAIRAALLYNMPPAFSDEKATTVDHEVLSGASSTPGLNRDFTLADFD